MVLCESKTTYDNIVSKLSQHPRTGLTNQLSMITITIRGAYFLGEVIMCNLLAPGHFTNFNFCMTCRIIAANDQDSLIEHSISTENFDLINLIASPNELQTCFT